VNVQLFIPCFVDQLYPNVGLNSVKILEKLGCTVSYNRGQTCCGQPAFNSGFMHECKSVSKKFIKDFKGDDYIVSPSGSCVGFVRNSFDTVFEGSRKLAKAQQVGKRAFEITEFIVDILGVEDLGAKFDAQATYHDACGALRECKIKEAPRKLLANVEGLRLTEMQESETCCGFGGTFAIKYDQISLGMAHTKVQSAVDIGATHIISTDVSCLMHIDGFIEKQGIELKTAHIVDILASS